MNCNDCEHYRYFKTFYDEWKGWQYDGECNCPFEEMEYECAKELDCLDEWYEAHPNEAHTTKEIMECREEDAIWN